VPEKTTRRLLSEFTHRFSSIHEQRSANDVLQNNGDDPMSTSCFERPHRVLVFVALVVTGAIILGIPAHADEGTGEDPRTRPLVTTLEVEGIRNPFTKRVQGLERIEVPFQTLPGSRAPGFYADGTLVGGLSGPHQVGRAYITPCLKGSTADGSVACVRVEGLNAPGSYEGTLDVTDNSDDSDRVTLKVTITDHVAWPFAASLGGVLIAVGSLWLAQWVRPYWGLKGRVARLREQLQFHNEHVCAPPYKGVTIFARGSNWPTDQGKISLTWDGQRVHELEAAKKWWTFFYVPGDKVSERTHWISARTETGATQRRMPFIAPCRSLDNWKQIRSDLEPAMGGRTAAGLASFVIGVAQRAYRAKADGFFHTFEEELNQYKQRFIWDTSADDYIGLVNRLNTVSEDIDRFRDKFGPGLDALAGQFDTFKDYLAADPLEMGDKLPEALIEVIAEQLKGTDVPVGALQARLDKWQSLVDLMKQWMGLAEDIQRYGRWITALDDISLLGEEKSEIGYAQARAREARYELYDVATAAELESVHTQHELSRTYEILARLGAKYDVWIPRRAPEEKANLSAKLADWSAADEAPVPTEMFTLFALEAPNAMGEALTLKRIGDRIRNRIADLLNRTTGEEQEEETPSTRWIRARLALDVGLLLFALVVAVITSLKANYFGKPFGTGVDYLYLLFLSGGIDVTVTGLLAIISRFFAHQ
jgi:hypothetical protein